MKMRSDLYRSYTKTAELLNNPAGQCCFARFVACAGNYQKIRNYHVIEFSIDLSDPLWISGLFTPKPPKEGLSSSPL